MRPADFRFCVGDDQVPWDYTIRDSNGDQVDVDGTVVLDIRPQDQSSASRQLAGVAVGTTPYRRARYLFKASDAFTTGRYDAVWVITRQSGEVLTYPVRSPDDLVPGQQFLVVEVAARP